MLQIRSGTHKIPTASALHVLKLKPAQRGKKLAGLCLANAGALAIIAVGAGYRKSVLAGPALPS